MGRQGGRLRCIAAAVIALAAMAPAVKPAHAADVPSDATVIRGGFSAAGGLSAAGHRPRLANLCEGQAMTAGTFSLLTFASPM